MVLDSDETHGLGFSHGSTNSRVQTARVASRTRGAGNVALEFKNRFQTKTAPIVEKTFAIDLGRPDSSHRIGCSIF
jgi:hypothetical protein